MVSFDRRTVLQGNAALIAASAAANARSLESTQVAELMKLVGQVGRS